MRPMSIQDQPPPCPGEGDLWRRVIDGGWYSPRVVALMEERRRLGIERYGTPLQAHNGRNALVDALQEALDLRVYLEQCYVEQRGNEIECRVMMVDADCIIERLARAIDADSDIQAPGEDTQP